MIKVGMYFDPYGVMDMTTEEEQQEVQDYLQEILGEQVDYKFQLLPHQLQNERLDLYIFDIGGLASQWGQDSMVDNLYRTLIRQVEEKSSCLFILWSSFTCKWWKYYIEDEFPEFNSPNVLIRYPETYGNANDSMVKSKIKEWCK